MFAVPRDGRSRRRPTATSAFGVSRRESHDASEFYRRFAAPTVSDDDDVCHPGDRRGVDRVFLGDIRHLPGTLAPASVALVVTSPPYFSGKEYEAAIGQGSVPSSYHDYLGMLTGVLGACAEALEPGGRMAVNVANLGRKPYRSLSADVIRILEEDLGLLLRGEIVWQKARGAAGNCAWGTYQRPGDPVLRDVTERVVIASKGRFDRAIPPAERAARGYPSEATITRDEFLEATLDVWELPPESARRVGHPAPFPVDLPQRLIELYTYRDDLVLDPFMGAGTTAVAAVRTGRRFAGFDTDASYVAGALARVAAERQDGPASKPRSRENPVHAPGARLPAVRQAAQPGEEPLARAVREGRRAYELARWLLEEAGFSIAAEHARLQGGVDVSFVATGRNGDEWLFDLTGSFARGSSSLRRPETVWREVGKAAILTRLRPGARVVLLSTAVPSPTSAAGRALAAACDGMVTGVVSLLEEDDRCRLRSWAAGEDG